MMKKLNRLIILLLLLAMVSPGAEEPWLFRMKKRMTRR
jgi:hypothetical protein